MRPDRGAGPADQILSIRGSVPGVPAQQLKYFFGGLAAFFLEDPCLTPGCQWHLGPLILRIRQIILPRSTTNGARWKETAD